MDTAADVRYWGPGWEASAPQSAPDSVDRLVPLLTFCHPLPVVQSLLSGSTMPGSYHVRVTSAHASMHRPAAKDQPHLGH